MQNQATQAYQRVAKQTANPSEREADLLTQSAMRLQKIRDNWETNYKDLASALQFTNRLWGIFMAALANSDHPLPDQTRQNVLNLGIFVLSRIVEIQVEPTPEKLNAIININRELAAGLREMPSAP